MKEVDMLKIDDETRKLWRSRARKERLRKFLEGVGAVVVLTMFGIMAWLFLAVTPNQMSAEADIVTEQLESVR